MPLFIPNRNFPREMQDDADYQEGVGHMADEVKRHAEIGAEQVGAPWMPRSGHETIEVVQENGETWVVNTDHGGHLMEYGSKNNPPHAILDGAARAAGLELSDET